MRKPFISVLVDTFNQENFIETAINSVLAQDFPTEEREILIVDDGSTDRTPDLLRKFGTRIRILRKENGGQASAFNYSIPQCRGEIIAFLDGDDWWAPGKLSAVAQAFGTHRDVGMVGHSVTEVLSDGSERQELVLEAPQFRIDSVPGARLFRMRKSFLGTSRMACRVDLLRRIGPVPNALIFEADEFLFTLGALFSNVLLLREPLTYYRLHDKNLFQLGPTNHAGVPRKRNVILALIDALRKRFAEEQVQDDVANVVLETLQNEADMLRLALGQGTSFDAFRAEVQNYRIFHERASATRRWLKYISLLPSLLLSPRSYNAYKEKLAANSLYVQARRRFIRTQKSTHAERVGAWKL